MRRGWLQRGGDLLMDATAGPCVRVSTSEPGADGPASPPRPAPPSPPLSSPPLPPISPSPPPRRRRRINGMLQGGAQGTTTHRSIREARDLRRCQRTCNFSTFSTFFTASIAVSLAIAIIPSSPAIVSRHHHPVITIPSSPSCHHHPVVTTTAPPAEPTCWGLTPESPRPDATFILKLIVTKQTSAQ